jgi:hypothetical protein
MFPFTETYTDISTELMQFTVTEYAGTARIQVSNPCLMNEWLQLFQQLISLEKGKGC